MIDFGAVLTALINFVIVAAVVYFLVVVPMNYLAERRKRGEEPEPQAPAEDIAAPAGDPRPAASAHHLRPRPGHSQCGGRSRR